jgi:hypothetical protein
MAGELLGPDASSRTITLGLGQTAHGRTATVYTDTAATSLATIYTYDGTGTPGAAISGSQVTIDSNSQLPQFWFPSAGVDTLYVRVAGRAGITTITADVDARLDVVAGITQGAAVADQGALTASAAGALTATAPAALTAVAAAGATPTDDEFDALLADVTALRTVLAAAVVDLAAIRTATNAGITDLGTARTKVNALLGSLRTAGIIDT